MSAKPVLLRLDSDTISLVFSLAKRANADLIYLGARLTDREDLDALFAASKRAPHESQPDLPPKPGILPEVKHGWTGRPAVEITSNGQREFTDFELSDWTVNKDRLEVRFTDRQLGLELSQSWTLGAIGEVRCAIHNASDRPFIVHRLSSISLPIPPRFDEVTAFSGRWAAEMQETQRRVMPEGFSAQSVAGKPGFNGGNWALLHNPGDGEVLGAHLCWSGDFESDIDADTQGSGDGRALLQMSAKLDDRGIVLAPEERFDAPAAVFAYGKDRSELAQRFHQHVRSITLPGRSAWSPRKVHLNSWEALGFGLSEAKLKSLADRAAALGVERFVLDDGWFGDRRNDQTSLGDWFASADVLPNGLDPLIEHVQSLGMDFGLWVEPEMVSPTSDLYAAHPDWCLHIEGHQRPTMRHQLVLDLTRSEVADYVFTRLDALLTNHCIAYIKWDHNRDLFPVADRSFGQTCAVYDLLDRLRVAHPAVEIESCSSGGGRVDFAILSRTHRVWPSDNNDAIERVRIITAWSQFLPLEVLGNHVGPSPNPITGRELGMGFRAKVAMFGHMGIEADPACMSTAEHALLAKHIELYKQWREVLHSGTLSRLTHSSESISGLIAVLGGRGLALVAQTQFEPQFDAAPIRLAGLDSGALYKVTLPKPWPSKASLYLPDWEQWRTGLTLSGQALMTHGLSLPLTHPETAWLVALERIAE